MTTDRPPVEESLATAALLTFSGGFLDGFTYVGHGHVFANAMSGNVVLLGLAAATGDWRQAFRHVLPILAFLAGVFLARLLHLPALMRFGRPGPFSLGLEILFLIVVACLPAAFPDAPIVLGIASLAALQTTSFARLHGTSYSSVMTTGNLRRAAESLYDGLLPHRDAAALVQARRFAAICLCFLAGATLGGLLTPHWHNFAAAVPMLGLAAAFVLIRATAPAAVT